MCTKTSTKMVTPGYSGLIGFYAEFGQKSRKSYPENTLFRVDSDLEGDSAVCDTGSEDSAAQEID